MSPNGGGSIKDMVSGQHRAIERVERRVSELGSTLDDLTTRVRMGHDAYGVGTFEASAAGLWTECSPAQCRAMGCSEEEMLGYGWLSFLQPGDRDKVREEWTQCVQDRRVFDIELCFRSATGQDVPGRVVARPSVGQAGEVRVWHGFITYSRRANDYGREA